MAKENENVNQENQNPVEINEEETCLAMVQIPWWKKVLNVGKYGLAAVLGFVGKMVFDKIRGGSDDDSGEEASESND